MNQRYHTIIIRDLKAAHALQVAALEARIRQLERENRLLCRRNTKLETAARHASPIARPARTSASSV